MTPQAVPVDAGGLAVPEQLSFLPPPPFSPTWPTKGTLPDVALSMFLAGQMLDHSDFEANTQSWRLSAVVFQLKELGWPIESFSIPSPTDDNPSRVVSLYHLPAKWAALALESAGDTPHDE